MLGKVIVGVVFGSLVGFGLAGGYRAEPPKDCTDRVIRLEGHEIQCSHRDHVLLRGREDGAFWICLCDAMGAEAKRVQKEITR